MKKLINILGLLLVVSLSYASNDKKIKTDETETERTYRIVNHELRELKFRVVRNGDSRADITFERAVGSWYYQILLIKKKNCVKIDMYATINGNFKMRWTDPKIRELVFDDIDNAIDYRLLNNERMPRLMFDSPLWVENRDEIMIYEE